MYYCRGPIVLADFEIVLIEAVRGQIFLGEGSGEVRGSVIS